MCHGWERTVVFGERRASMTRESPPTLPRSSSHLFFLKYGINSAKLKRTWPVSNRRQVNLRLFISTIAATIRPQLWDLVSTMPCTPHLERLPLLTTDASDELPLTKRPMATQNSFYCRQLGNRRDWPETFLAHAIQILMHEEPAPYIQISERQITMAMTAIACKCPWGQEKYINLASFPFGPPPSLSPDSTTIVNTKSLSRLYHIYP